MCPCPVFLQGTPRCKALQWPWRTVTRLTWYSSDSSGSEGIFSSGIYFPSANEVLDVLHQLLVQWGKGVFIQLKTHNVVSRLSPRAQRRGGKIVASIRLRKRPPQKHLKAPSADTSIILAHFTESFKFHLVKTLKFCPALEKTFVLCYRYDVRRTITLHTDFGGNKMSFLKEMFGTEKPIIGLLHPQAAAGRPVLRAKRQPGRRHCLCKGRSGRPAKRRSGRRAGDK